MRELASDGQNAVRRPDQVVQDAHITSIEVESESQLVILRENAAARHGGEDGRAESTPRAVAPAAEAPAAPWPTRRSGRFADAKERCRLVDRRIAGCRAPSASHGAGWSNGRDGTPASASWDHCSSTGPGSPERARRYASATTRGISSDLADREDPLDDRGGHGALVERLKLEPSACPRPAGWLTRWSTAAESCWASARPVSAYVNPGSLDRDEGGDPAGCPVVPVRHETRAELVGREYRADRTTVQRLVEQDVLGAGHTEDVLDAQGLERAAEEFGAVQLCLPTTGSPLVWMQSYFWASTRSAHTISCTSSGNEMDGVHPKRSRALVASPTRLSTSVGRK